jgi:hypothetical protein
MLTIPSTFIWTKIGRDSDQAVEAILRRKELERRAGSGEFWWGIGEWPALSSVRKAWRVGTRDVLATKPLTPGKKGTANPILTWAYYDDGCQIGRIPLHVVVTSREQESYYALVCNAGTDLTRSDSQDELRASNYKHLTSGKRVSPSLRQTTFPVKKVGSAKNGRTYKVAFRACLRKPCVQLFGRRKLSQEEVDRLHNVSEDGVGVDAWLEFASAVRGKDKPLADITS